MSRMGMCHHFGCNHFAQGAFCERHTPPPVVMSAEYEAVRIDPTTDRDQWDVWDDGGLEQPGGGDEW